MRHWIAVFVLALSALALAALPACDTRPTCEVICENDVRCGFADEASCPSSCAADIATRAMDCRVAIDTYHRCWSAQGTCPASRSVPVEGCSEEHAAMTLDCARF